MKLSSWFSLTFVLLLTTASSCNKENSTTSGIPLVPVDIRIFVSEPSFINVAVPGGFEYITGGSRGILLYRLNQEQFVALDRHCTFEPDNPCGTVEVDSTFIFATDTCCGSSFLITDGSVSQGPAARGLQQYNTTFDGQVLRIFN